MGGLSAAEGPRARQGGDRYVLQPDLAAWCYQAPTDSHPVADGFHYTSDTNDQWYTIEEITKILETDV